MSKADVHKNTIEDCMDVSYELKFRSSLNSNNPLNPCQRKLFSSSSMRTLSQNEESQILALQKENESLRKRIEYLTNQLKEKEQKNAQNESCLKEEMIKLKRIIEKSFYSMKNMEKQTQTALSECALIKKYNKKAQKIIRELENQKINLVDSIKALKANHKKEINLVWERVADLQKNLQIVVDLMERDIKEGKRLKKDYKDLTSSTIQRRELNFRLRSYQ